MSSDPDQPYTGPTIPMRRPAEAARRQIEPPRRAGKFSPRRRPRRNWRAWLLAGLAGIMLLVGIILVIGLGQLRSLAEQTVVPDVRRGQFSVPPVLPFTMLLIGIDERPDFPEEGVRGDSLIVMRVDPAGGWVSLLSIPRDTLVEVEELGPAKINAAYAYGYNNAEGLYGAGTSARQAGMAHAAEAARRLLNTNIDYSAQVNFDGFARVVDTLGGITIDVPRRIVDNEYPTADFGVMQVVFEPGPQRMDGERALIYARTRHADSDFGRGERQQQVLRAILDELRSRGTLGQALLLPALRESIGDTIATTLPFDRLDAALALSRVASSLRPDSLLRLQISPDTAAFREEGSAIIWEPGDIQALVAKLLRGPSIEAEAARVQVLNATETVGLAGRLTNELARAGITMLPAGDAPAGDHTGLVVYDLRNKPITTRRIAELLNGQVRSGVPADLVSDADIVVIVGR
jgi:polyisoprenyl-teichoic acid--peptidoglycan teichoic acid transferase